MAISKTTFDRLNPVTNELATRAPAATIDDANAAATRAGEAFRAWAAVSPNARRGLLLKAADILERRTNEVVARMTAETACAPPWAQFNAHLAANMLREAASMTTQISGEVIPSDKPGCFAMALRQPVGVVFGIAPWNAPIILGVRAFAMPLACGNTVVMKASELCPGTHLLIGEVLHEAGFPEGVANVITNAPADAPLIVRTLIEHPAVKRINFTGSTRVGRIVAELAARKLKPVLLELGGKAPLIVLDDADIDSAVNAAAFGAFMHQGQICMSTERVIVDDRIADQFVAKFAEKVKSVPKGPVIDGESAERVENLIDDAIAAGATIVAGGEREGAVVEPCILDNVTSTMRIYHEESFGPVVCIVRAQSVDDAVRLANDTEYGLSAAVFGRDIGRALGVAKRIESGMCHINGPTVSDEAQMPFGGVKASGYGRFGGRAAIEEFTELRWITIEDAGQHYPF